MYILYGITTNYLQLPMYIRIIGEIAILLLVMVLLLFLIKIAIIILLWISGKACNPVFSVLRCCICVIFAKLRKVYEWDEKIGGEGQKAITLSETKLQKVSEWRIKKILLRKSNILILGLLYLMAVFPFIGLDRFIDEHYLVSFYKVNDIFAKLEAPFVEKAKEYPPLFTWKEEAAEASMENESEATTEEAAEESIEPVYLILAEDIYYANVREFAGADSEPVCVVSKEDVILFLNEYEVNGNRRWLKVLIETRENIEGWMSEKVFEEIFIGK